MTDGKHDFLAQLEGLYVAQGLPTRRTPPGVQMPAETLWVIFEGFGRDDVPLDLGFSFVPLPPAATVDDVHILQTMCELETALTPGRVAGLYRMIGRINVNLPIGAFGLLEQTGTVFLKQNCLVDLRRPARDNAILVDRHAGVMLHSLSLFADALRDAADGAATPDEALAGTTMAALFAT
jgi:hypothetical protein